MITPVKVKDEKRKGRRARLEFRATPQQQMLIHLAAQAVNKSVTQFVLDSACAAAENALLDQRFFILEEEDWQKFHYLSYLGQFLCDKAETYLNR